MSDSEGASRPGLFARLRQGLSRSAASLAGSLTDIVAKRKLDNETLAWLEEALIRADMGADMAAAITADVARDRYDQDVSTAELREALAKAIARVLAPVAKPFIVERGKKPFVVLVAGVNGTGKTTTIGKLAARLSHDGLKVVLAAGDTFRAAAIEQLKIWGDRAHADVVAGAQGSDAASLAFEALRKARAENADVLLIDTAGRLQNKAGLMAELEKISRVLKKIDGGAPHAALLVLDATTGQNAIAQVDAFRAATPLTGLIMTKLDGTAKGGILVALADRFGLPIHFVGVGEGTDDLQVFDADNFARALTGI
jgi:fused signal recognition particle receptor